MLLKSQGLLRAKAPICNKAGRRTVSVHVNAQRPQSQAAALRSSVSSALSKRELLQAGLLCALSLSSPAFADEEAAVASSSSSSGNRVYLDVKLEGKPIGRITIELFDDVKTGAARFRDLAVGKMGVGYRLSRFNGIFPTYIRCEGVKSLSYSATAESPIAGGDSLDELEKELAGQSRSHSEAGLVSIIVRDAKERVVKERLVARDGKLVTMTQTLGEAPNGTTFCITRSADAALDDTNLIVGRIVSGADVVDLIGQQPFARPRDSYYDQPFFSVAKAIGDKRADTAELGFNRPLKRIVVSGGGLA